MYIFIIIFNFALTKKIINNFQLLKNINILIKNTKKNIYNQK